MVTFRLKTFFLLIFFNIISLSSCQNSVGGDDIDEKQDDTKPPLRAGAPTFSHLSGTYDEAIAVAITTYDSAVTFHYTIDDSDPTASSPVYSGPIAVNAGETKNIKAIGTKPGAQDSSVVSASYHIRAWSALTLPQNSGSGSILRLNDSGDLFLLTSAYIYRCPSGTNAFSSVILNGLSGSPKKMEIGSDGALYILTRTVDSKGFQVWRSKDGVTQAVTELKTVPEMVNSDISLALDSQNVPWIAFAASEKYLNVYKYSSAASDWQVVGASPSTAKYYYWSFDLGFGLNDTPVLGYFEATDAYGSAGWARLADNRSRLYQARRLETVGTFVRHMAIFEPGTVIPS